MLRDVFYYNKKPNAHPREKPAKNLADARTKSTTEHFWIINEYCDYSGFDWEFDFELLPDEDVWAGQHNNAWPSYHQKDSGTWLCPKEYSDIIVYRADVGPVKRKNELNPNWVLLDTVDQTKFDFSWHPDPTDPPYIYAWGSKYLPAEVKPCIEYHVPNAIGYKYMEETIELLPQWDRWVEIQTIDKNNTTFDFSWRPDPTSPPYIYVWGNKYIDGTLKSTLEYHVVGAIEKKYMPELIAVLPEWDRWVILQDIDKNTFDFSWRPDPTEPPYIYVFGNEYYDGNMMPTIEYIIPGATDRKYINDELLRVKLQPHPERFEHLEECHGIDYSWVPDPTSPPYIYAWGNQWNKPEDKISIRYMVEGATEYKYMEERAIRKPCMDNWHIPDNIDKDRFDYSWEPSPYDDPYVYQFGTQWQKTGGPCYIVKDAIETKYIDIMKAVALPCKDNWIVPDNMDESSIDFSWHPDSTEDPYIYTFGTQWNDVGGPEYHVPGATERKYSNAIIGKTKVSRENWKIIIPIDEKTFDFSWVPHPESPPYIYIFGNQWNTSEIEPTIGYIVPGATQKKYINDIKANVIPDMKYWEIPENIDVSKFDFSWRPDPGSPPYIYQFGTLLDENDGPRYIAPDNDGTIVHLERKEIIIEELEFPKYFIKTTLEALIIEHKDEIFWALNPEIDYSNFDFKWVPDKENVYHINAFGTRDNIDSQTYFVNGKMWQKGYHDINYIEDKIIDVKTNIDIFFVDRGNIESSERYEQLSNRFKNVSKTRYLNSWVDTINRCIAKASTNLCWILNSELDYSNFEFDFYPSPWQMKMLHVFGTQWSHWGTTFMVNKNTFSESAKYIKIIEHLPNIHFVKDRKAIATNCLYDVYLINHGNKELEDVKNTIQSNISDKTLTIVNYENTYLKTFNKILNMLPAKKDHYIWVCNSICDYSDFDFRYICDPFSREQLHVFPSNKQKFGDTFLINVNKLRSLVDDMMSLNDYDKINYNNHQRVNRYMAPIIVINDDTHCNAINESFDFPYAIFKTIDNDDIEFIDTEPMSLWANNSKNIIVNSTGGTCISVPKEARNYIEKELYDYPYIIKKDKLIRSKPIDIVFLSNGEKCAEENYEHLLNVTKGLDNRVVRIDGINGRVQAYHAALEASNTPWAFTVFAKLKVDEDFDFDWQPDRLQIPKHYIFHAKNPVNGLIYGHQAMIAYNKKLTLANTGKGLDFTLDDEHEVIELLSGMATYNTDEYSTWRTAFREVLKLRSDTTNIGKERLNIWNTVADGDFAEYSIYGAKDAIEYYDNVDGDINKLKLSYEWDWLRKYFDSKY